MKKKMDGQPSPRALSLSSAAMKRTKKSLPLLVWSFPTTTFDPPRSERDINLGRFARIECFSSRISSRCVIIDSRVGRGARVVTQNPIRFWRQSINKRDGNFHREQRRRFLFSKKMRKKSRANEEEKPETRTRNARIDRTIAGSARGIARFLSSKRGKEKRERERDPALRMCIFILHSPLA